MNPMVSKKPAKLVSVSQEKITFLLILCCFILIVSFVINFLPLVSSPISP